MTESINVAEVRRALNLAAGKIAVDVEAGESTVRRRADLRKRSLRRRGVISIASVAAVAASSILIALIASPTPDGGESLGLPPVFSTGQQIDALCGLTTLEHALESAPSGHYDTVFVGVLEDVREVRVDAPTGQDEPSPSLVFTFAVERVLAGHAEGSASVVVESGSSEAVSFERGAEYVVVAHTNDDGSFSPNPCVGEASA